MSLPEFKAVMDGFSRFHGGSEDEDTPSTEALYALLAETA